MSDAPRSRFARGIQRFTIAIHVPVSIAFGEIARRLGAPWPFAIGAALALLSFAPFPGVLASLLWDRPRSTTRRLLLEEPYYVHWCACFASALPITLACVLWPLVCLARGDCRRLAERLSCDQAIAADGFFSLGMIAEFDASLAEYGPSFYRHLFWETGFVGQFLYLEAEAAGARATGIGCFYDDPVHDTLGLQGHAAQSLYHFTVGVPVEDTRLTTAPGYAWEIAE